MKYVSIVVRSVAMSGILEHSFGEIKQEMLRTKDTTVVLMSPEMTSFAHDLGIDVMNVIVVDGKSIEATIDNLDEKYHNIWLVCSEGIGLYSRDSFSSAA